MNKNVHNYSVIASIKFFKSCKATKNTLQPCFYKTSKKRIKYYVCKYFNHDAPAEDKVEIVFVTQKGKTTLSKFFILSKPRLERL